jgi:VanZ family protein
MTLDRLLRPWRGRLTASRHEPWLGAVPSLLYMLMIFAVSAIPGSEFGAAPDDRLAHFVEYAILGIVLSFSAAGFLGRTPSLAAFVSMGLFGLAFAASDEWHQSFVPGRDSSVKDVAFDALGMTTALIAIYVLAHPRERRT